MKRRGLIIGTVVLAGVSFGMALGGLFCGLPGGACILVMAMSGGCLGAFAWANRN